MLKQSHREPELFPNGWCVRRDDGTIAAIQGVKGIGILASRALAKARASRMSLAAKPLIRNQTSHARVPKVLIDGKRRPGSDSVFVSMKLPMVSTGSGKNRRFRTAYVGLGNAGLFTQKDIDAAWKVLYSQWAWATAMKADYPPIEVFGMPVPDDVEFYADLIVVPRPATLEDVLKKVL